MACNSISDYVDKVVTFVEKFSIKGEKCTRDATIVDANGRGC